MSDDAQLEELKAKLLQFAQDWLADRGWDRGFEAKWINEGRDSILILNFKEAILLKFNLQLIEKDNYPIRLLSAENASYHVRNKSKDFVIELLGVLLVEVVSKRGPSMFLDTDDFQLCKWKNISFISEASAVHFLALDEIHLEGLESSSEIYFLGENGDGKTLLLQSLHLTFAMEDVLRYSHDSTSAAALQLANSKNGGSLKGKDGAGKLYELLEQPDYVLNHFFAYGPNRSLFDSDEFDTTGFMSLYTHDTKLFSPERLLEFAKNGDVMRKARLSGIRTIGAIPLDDIKVFFEDLLEGNVAIEPTKHGEWRFHEKGYALPFRQLSEGYKNLLIWVSDLLYRFQSAEPETTSIADFQGVVILDEVELHLHPRWQATLVPKLRKYLPRVQWFFSTHSPAVVTGAGEDAIFYRVYRDQASGKSHVSEPYHKRNMNHMMFNTLMTSPLFGLDSARISPETPNPDTSDSYVSSRVAHAVEEQLKQQHREGKVFISESEIDAIIAEVLGEELKS